MTIYRGTDDRYGVAVALQDLGMVLYWQGEKALGQSLIEESLAELKGLGVQLWTALATLYLGNIARREGDFSRARSLYIEGMTCVKDQYARPAVSYYAVDLSHH